MQGAGYFAGVAGTVKKIGVAEGDMAGATFDLLGDISEDCLDRDDEKTAVVYGYDWTVAAGV